MSCNKSLPAWRKPGGGITFDKNKGIACNPVSIPCGQCMGCRIDKSRDWQVRLMHESMLQDDNMFLTLTYDPEHIPEGQTLQIKHYQDFMKRLRKHFAPQKIRFFHCGEYGEKTERPHYHAIIFNLRMMDAIQVSEKPFPFYTSEILTKLWGHGHVTIGLVTPETCFYVAKYVTKKVTGKNQQSEYESVDPDTGEIFARKPPYCTMSRNPGIARDFFEKYKSGMYVTDSVILNAREVKLPKYYNRIYEKQHSQHYEQIQETRRKTVQIQKERGNISPERSAVKEKSLQHKHNQRGQTL